MSNENVVVQELGTLYDSLKTIAGRDLGTYKQILDKKSPELLEKVGPDKRTDLAAYQDSKNVIGPLEKQVEARLGVNSTYSETPLTQAPTKSSP